MTQIKGADGLSRWRDLKAKNKYNPEGITLESLRKTLAPEYHEHLQKIREHEESGSGIRLGAIDVESSYSDKKFMIPDGDKDVAKFIAEYPITIIAAPEVSRTIARWKYSARYSRVNQIKNHGREMLKIAFPPAGHRPLEIPYTEPSMLATYQDAMVLAKGINKCMKDCKQNGETIEQHLAFASDLRPLGFDLSFIMKQAKPDLTPSAFASTLLERFSGLKRTAIRDVLNRAKDTSSGT